jgi:hypothetical protein
LVVLIKRAQDNDLITGLATNFLHDWIAIIQYVDNAFFMFEYSLDIARNFNLGCVYLSILLGWK